MADTSQAHESQQGILPRVRYAFENLKSVDVAHCSIKAQYDILSMGFLGTELQESRTPS